MCGAIYFDDQTPSQAGEIGYARSYRMLRAKTHSADAVAQMRPEDRFGVGELAPEGARPDERFRLDVSHRDPSLPRESVTVRMSHAYAGSVRKCTRAGILRLSPSTASRSPSPMLAFASHGGGTMLGDALISWLLSIHCKMCRRTHRTSLHP